MKKIEILENQPPYEDVASKLRDAIATFNDFCRSICVQFRGGRYDVEEKKNLIKKTLEYFLQHNELKNDPIEYLSKVVERELIK